MGKYDEEFNRRAKDFGAMQQLAMTNLFIANELAESNRLERLSQLVNIHYLNNNDENKLFSTKESVKLLIADVSEDRA